MPGIETVEGVLEPVPPVTVTEMHSICFISVCFINVASNGRWTNVELGLASRVSAVQS